MEEIPECQEIKDVPCCFGNYGSASSQQVIGRASVGTGDVVALGDGKYELTDCMLACYAYGGNAMYRPSLTPKYNPDKCYCTTNAIGHTSDITFVTCALP
eukprot:TRINITY_DN25135_c0_g1_i1.p2 TRINITY_DN25135_c0_g1~~TRINITY_DN25135_c0_g1_i1.p2  ORF type:complete len:100 (-),score=7.76 TRINITY_DN25135_c0_g1_i1:27-326(-)